MSDYLFDKQGVADPEVEPLEQLLAPLAYHGQLRPLPAREPAATPAPRRRSRLIWISAAGLAAVTALVLLVLRPWRPVDASWTATVRGSATRLAVGEWLDTGDTRARLHVPDIGTVDLEPGTRARIVASTSTQHRVQLERGTLSAIIHAPPRRFAIETAHTLLYDLGCAFTLTVDSSGVGRVVVTEGSVALADRAGHEVTVPAGSQCQLTPSGPATPEPAARAPGGLRPEESPAPSPPQPADPARPSEKSAEPAPPRDPDPPRQPETPGKPAPARKQQPASKSGPAGKSAPAGKSQVPAKSQLPGTSPRPPQPLAAPAPGKSETPRRSLPAPPPKKTDIKLDHDAFKDLR